MPAWEPSVQAELQVGEKFKFFSDWADEQALPTLKVEHSLAHFKRNLKSAEPDLFASADQSATTCSVPSPVPEETKGSFFVRVVAQNKANTGKRVTMIRNPGKIVKPPRKLATKWDVEEKVLAKKAQKSYLRKEKLKTAPQTDFAQKTQRSDLGGKSEAKTIAELDNATGKYYMNFDFYFKRTSFRTMTLYFKTAFKPFFERWKADRRKLSI